MFDGSLSPDLMQRAQGRAAVALSVRGGRVRLDRLEQSGSANAFLPRVHRSVPEVVFLNTSGGLTGGDRLAYALDLGAGAAAVATTQTAERAYASAGGVARMDVTLSLGAGATLDWLPQETICFNAAALSRRTVADLAPGAGLLMAEMLVLGRHAMGETVRNLDLLDWREVRRSGVPVLLDPLRLTGGCLLGQPALLGGARAVALVALVAEGAEALLAAMRSAVQAFGTVQAAASGWGGKCVVRMLAHDAMALRAAVAAVLTAIRGVPLPRVWQIRERT